MVHKSGRQNFELGLVLFLIFICCVATSPYYMFWSAVTFCFAMVYIMGKNIIVRCIDVMFADENGFMYEPDYNQWRTFNEPEY